MITTLGRVLPPSAISELTSLINESCLTYSELKEKIVYLLVTRYPESLVGQRIEPLCLAESIINQLRVRDKNNIDLSSVSPEAMFEELKRRGYKFE